MTDASTEIAQFLHEATGRSPDELRAEVTRRWPGASRDQIMRGVKLATELHRADAAEWFAKEAALAEGDASLLTPDDVRAVVANSNARPSGQGK